jgi:HIT zinc finger
MPAIVNNSCVVCSNLKSSYKCPKCRSCYCSLQCNRVHKSACSAGSGTVQSEVSERHAKTSVTLTQQSGTITSTAPTEMVTGVTKPIEQKFYGAMKIKTEAMASKPGGAEATAPSVDLPNMAEINSTQASKNTAVDDDKETIKINKIVEMFSGYDDSDAESEEKESRTITENTIQAENQLQNTEEILIEDIPEPDIIPDTETTSSSSSSTTRRINHNIDSNDMSILSSETVQTLLKSDWARNVLKSSRLRDDILSVDSSQNRQGASLHYYQSICER